VRRSAVRTAAGVLLLSLAVAANLPGQNAARNSPQRPLAVVRLNGAEYLPAADFGARFGLKPLRSAVGRKLTLKSNWTTIELEADTRECAINGVRVFLGEAIRDHRGALHVSRIDAEKLITPILLPGSGQTSVPAVRTIVIDPGHGGSDPGMENKALRLQEKTLALDTALRLKQELERQGYKVVLTRDTDVYLDQQERSAIANANRAGLFVSIHFNAIARDRKTSGVEVFTFAPQFQRSTNAWSPGTGNDTEKDPAPVNRHDHWSVVLAQSIQRRFVVDLKAFDRGRKIAHWGVLRVLNCPGILVECGFLTSVEEARKIATPHYRQHLAQAIANGIRDYAATAGDSRAKSAGASVRQSRSPRTTN